MIQCTCQKDIPKQILADTDSSYKSQKISIYITDRSRQKINSTDYTS